MRIPKTARMTAATASLLTTIALCAAPAAADARHAPFAGRWISAEGGLVIDLQPCEDALCGKIVWLQKPFRKTGEPRLDSQNPDPALRDRPWCGITVIEGLLADGEARMAGGRLYDPKTGSTFSVEATLSGPSLRLRAYLGLRALGRTEVFTRSTDAEKTNCSLVSTRPR